MPKPPAHGPKWPRHYLLQIFALAVKHGDVLLSPFPEDRVPSFLSAINRIRRRSDHTHDLYILPEYHLVSVGRWSPRNGGTLPIIYDNYTSADLPNITSTDGTALPAAPIARNDPDAEPDFTLPPGDLDTEDYLRDLIEQSTARHSSGSADDS